jgi:hypothetical protein
VYFDVVQQLSKRIGERKVRLELGGRLDELLELQGNAVRGAV